MIAELPPEEVSDVLDGVILSTTADGSHNTVSITAKWGSETLIVGREVPRDEFDASTALLVNDGSQTSVMAAYSWFVPPAGVKSGVCHHAVRQYSLTLETRLWEQDILTQDSAESDCQTPLLTRTSDGRGIAVWPEPVWINVAGHEVHQGGDAGITSLGPMIAYVEGLCGTCWPDHQTVPVFDPARGHIYSVTDTKSDSGLITALQPIDRLRQMANGDDRSSAWLNKHTIALIDGSEVYLFDISTGKYASKFSLGDDDPTTGAVVDPSAEVILIEMGSTWEAPARISAFTPDGRKLWTQKESTICAAGGGHVVVAVNGQLATLDSLTGEQLSYSDSQTCDGRIEGNYLIRGAVGNQEVVRLLP